MGSEDAFAVIGLAARLGGADDVDEFWLGLVRPAPTGGDRFGLDGSRAPRSRADRTDAAAAFLAAVRSAAENAGYDPATIGDGCGVFAGAMSQESLASVAERAGLRGPRVAVADALVATERAVAALRTGDCRLAIAGGGGWAVALKRLADALADHDHVRAVIQGIAVDVAGADPAETVLAALASAGAKPEDLAYLELRAGSPLTADSAELAAVADAFGRLAGGPPPTGGHRVGALPDDGGLGGLAGVAALVKAVLALEYEQLPPSLDGAGPHPPAAPFQIQDRVAPWPRVPGRPRLVGVVSAASGEASAHVVLAESPVQRYAVHAGEPRVVVWSGPTAAAEQTARRRLAALFISHGEQVFADAVATLQHGRAEHPFRAAAVCTGSLDAATALDGAASDGTPSGRIRVHTSPAPGSRPRRVVLVFPAEASLLPARALYRGLPAFAPALDGWLDLLDAAGLPAREQWSSGVDGPAVVFAVQAAIADLWRAAGVRPDAVVGDGIGLPAAGYAAGVLAPADAASLVRALLLGEEPHGEVAAVPASVPVFGTALGRALEPAEHAEPAVWAAPARAGYDVEALLGADQGILIDAGSGGLFSPPDADADGIVRVLSTAAVLWTEGHAIAWDTVGQPPPRHRVPLSASTAEDPAFEPDLDAPSAATAGGADVKRAQAARPAPAKPSCALVALTKPEDGPLLLAFPYAGASGRALQSLRGHLPPGFGLAVVDLPGHGLRMGERCLRDVDAVLATVLEALPTLSPSRLVLFGYSLGGALAYELAARLVEAGTPPEGLVVCGTRAPHTGVGHPPITHLPAGAPFLRMAVEMGLAAREMVEIPELAEWYAGPLQSDLTMSEHFPFNVRRGPLAVPTCVVGLSEDWLVPEPSLRAWEDLCLRPPLQVRIDGGHLVVNERQQDFGATIRAALETLLDPDPGHDGTGPRPAAEATTPSSHRGGAG